MVHDALADGLGDGRGQEGAEDVHDRRDGDGGPGERTLVETTVAMALAQSCQPLAMSKSTASKMMISGCQACFRTIPSSTLAMSSARSDASSRSW